MRLVIERFAHVPLSTLTLPTDNISTPQTLFSLASTFVGTVNESFLFGEIIFYFWKTEYFKFRAVVTYSFLSRDINYPFMYSYFYGSWGGGA